VYLYEAIMKVVEEGGNRPVDIREIAKAINERDLYRKKDGSVVTPWNVGARAIADVSQGPTHFDVLVRVRK